MRDIIQSVVMVQTARRDDGSLRLREYRGFPQAHPVLRALKRLNIAMSKVAEDSEQRYAILSQVFSRPYPITSTYDLTVGEVFAFIRLAFPNDPLVIETGFLAYIMEIKNHVTER